jgi:hypothetical protein
MSEKTAYGGRTHISQLLNGRPSASAEILATFLAHDANLGRKQWRRGTKLFWPKAEIGGGAFN